MKGFPRQAFSASGGDLDREVSGRNRETDGEANQEEYLYPGLARILWGRVRKVLP